MIESSETTAIGLRPYRNLVWDAPNLDMGLGTPARVRLTQALVLAPPASFNTRVSTAVFTNIAPTPAWCNRTKPGQ